MLSLGIGLRFEISVALQAGFLLILTQAVMKGLAFLCKGACHFYRDATSVAELAGTAAAMPLVAAAFSIALAGLAGVPPLAGFSGKWFAIHGMLDAGSVVGPAAVAAFLFNTLLSLPYYTRVLITLFRSGEGSARIRISPWIAAPILVLAALTLAIGLYPAPWLHWTAQTGAFLLALGR
jgi:formate hydrogenlyase subunit 3/multisubunit Na+/H+ antiporter MnhD subunit